ncbi:MAG: hypothetical protein FJW32_02230 [Acidobacteria bacterium]|nr:hypothetical protein [Acidobacteriota bacterium]
MAMLRMKEEGLLDCKLKPFSHILAASLFTALAQTPVISDLATTDDGYQVYFRLNGTFGVSGVYQLNGYVPDARRLSPYRLDALIRFQRDTILGPSVSGDGQTVLVNSSWLCSNLSFCGPLQSGNRAYFHQWGNPNEFTADGSASLSRNGRYVFSATGGPPNSSFASRLDDRATGAQIQIPTALRGFRNSVTNDGAVVGRFPFSNAGLALWAPNRDTQNLNVEEVVTDAAVNSIGTRIAYTSAPAGAWLYDIASGTRTQIDARASSASISNDGNRVVYVVAGTPYLYNHISGQKTPLLSRTDVSSAVIAGYGNVVAAATSSGKLFRIEIESASASEIYSALALEVSPMVSPGSWTVIRGGPFSRFEYIPLGTSTTPGLSIAPTEVEGIRVSIGMIPAPIVAIGTNWLIVQVPRRTALEAVPVLVTSPAAPSGVVATTRVVATAPVFLRTGYPRLPESDEYSIAHQNFGGRVTMSSPAVSDEVVHLYAEGLGPVDREVPDGTHNAVQPPARVTTPLNCSVDGIPVDASAYLAPFNSGLYQVDVRLPRIASARTARLVCMGASALIPVAP